MLFGIGNGATGLKAMVLGTVLLAAPTSVEAQIYPLMLSVEEPTDTRALQMEAEAIRLETERDRWDDAADLYRQAARLRDAGTLETARNYVKAGRLAYYAGEHRTAMFDLRNAGENAVAAGDVVTAARAYLDAAWIAVDLEEGELARDLTLRASRLTASPLLSQEDREYFQARVGSTAGL
jgi:hypothetical protein